MRAPRLPVILLLGLTALAGCYNPTFNVFVDGFTFLGPTSFTQCP